LADLEAALPELTYPAVLKPASKTVVDADQVSSTKAIYAATRAELIEKFTAVKDVPGRWLLQEYIPGEGGSGVGLLCDHGKVVASFAFKRLHEYPITGGASTLRESIWHPDMVVQATRLMEAMNWDGVAMAEFKIDSRDGAPKLIEVNGRFWGSLALAVASGVDFPYLLYKKASGEDLPAVSDYRVGVRCSWRVPGDIMYFLEALRLRPGRAATLLDFVRTLFVKDDVLSLSDPLPILGELKIGFRYLMEVLAGRRSIHGEKKRDRRL
jgi:predicted ATP-grasp superfamily ATP-dependent carboligase